MKNRRTHILDDYQYKKLHDFLNNYNEPLVAIFDIGTKACRIILAPKNVPHALYNEWTRGTFYNASVYSKLGEDVNPIDNILTLHSKKFWKVIQFVRFFKTFLEKSGKVKETDIHAFGTEVFRWLKNQNEVLKHFHEHTNVPLKVLSDDEESYFSLISLQYTVSFKNSNHISNVPKRDELDSIFLIDQGGGSTEISYFKSNNPNRNEHTSIGKFGSIALKDIFFRLDSSGNNIDPFDCNYSVPEQMNTLNNYIDNTLNNAEYFKSEESTKKIFYGMGSALHNMSNSSNIDSHNRRITLNAIETKLKDITLELSGKYRRISDLYGKIETGEIKDKELKKLTLFYGLPVYAHILRKYGVDEILLAGFGLRYGIYVYLYSGHRDLLSTKEIGGIPVIYKPTENKNQSKMQLKIPKDFIEEMEKNYSKEFKKTSRFEGLLSDMKDKSLRNEYEEEIQLSKGNINRLDIRYLSKIKADKPSFKEEDILQSIKEIKVSIEERFDKVDSSLFEIGISLDNLKSSIDEKEIEENPSSKNRAEELLYEIKKILVEKKSDPSEEEKEVIDQLNGELSTSAKLKLTIPIIPGLLKYETVLFKFSAKEPVKSWKDLWEALVKNK